jgi:hypothetical protein
MATRKQTIGRRRNIKKAQAKSQAAKTKRTLTKARKRLRTAMAKPTGKVKRQRRAS